MRRLAFLAVLLLAAAGGVLWWRSQTGAPPAKQQPPAPGGIAVAPKPGANREVTVYFARQIPGGLPGEFALAPVKRNIAPTAAPAEAALKALAGGPTAEERAQGFIATLPAGTRVLSVKVENGMATANVSRELQEKFNGGAEWEEVVLYSIVNTLTTDTGAETARIRLAGAPIESIGGHLAADKPLRCNNEIVARGKQGS